MTRHEQRAIRVLSFSMVALAGACGGDDAGDPAAPPATLVETERLDPGSTCAAGGLELVVGRDADGDGGLSDAEVERTQTVCDGEDGEAGEPGEPGAGALVETSTVPPGAECSDGGVRYDVGVDRDGDGALSDSEVVGTEYVCDSEGGARFEGVAYEATVEEFGTREVIVGPAGDPSAHRSIARPRNQDGGVDAFAVSPDGRWIAVRGRLGLDDGREGVWVFDVLAPDERRLAVMSLVDGGRVRELRWSPDSERLALIGDLEEEDVNEVYVVERDGTYFRQISWGSQGGDAKTDVLEWSPDGEHVVFAGDFNPAIGEQLSMASADGSELGYISDRGETTGQAVEATWAPDGRRVAFVKENDFGQWEIFTALPNPDSPGRVRVSGQLPMDGDAVSPRWSPDSTRLAYEADTIVEDERQLFTVGPTGSNRMQLTSGFVEFGAIVETRWAPDGSAILLRGDLETNGVSELFVLSPEGSGLSKISGPVADPGQGGVESARWSPDSARIAFEGEVTADRVDDVFVVNPDGTGRTAVTSGGPSNTSAGGLVWRADGQTLGFIRELESGRNAAFAVQRDGTGLERVSAPEEGFIGAADLAWVSAP